MQDVCNVETVNDNYYPEYSTRQTCHQGRCTVFYMSKIKIALVAPENIFER
jgi:hypothetical protein